MKVKSYSNFVWLKALSRSHQKG